MTGRPDADTRPFRWDLARREQLGRLVEGETASAYKGFHGDLQLLAAQVVARAGDSDLVFVGRSLESVFDYLSGMFRACEDLPNLTLLQVSVRYLSSDEDEKARQGLFDYFQAERLDPASIAGYGKQVRLIDVVASGETFGNLLDILRPWGDEQGADWNVVQRRLGFVGVTWRTKNSPNTWRWWQQRSWVRELTKPDITNVSVPGRLWDFLGNRQAKVTRSHPAGRWADPDTRIPARFGDHLPALRFAVDLYDRAGTRAERERFIAELTAQPQMRESWLRSLVLRLRGGA